MKHYRRSGHWGMSEDARGAWVSAQDCARLIQEVVDFFEGDEVNYDPLVDKLKLELASLSNIE